MKTIPNYPNYAITPDGRVWSKHRAENTKDNYKHGKLQKGGDHHWAKINEKDVMDILFLYHRDKVSAIKIGEQYGLNRRHIHDIVAGRVWKNIRMDFITHKFERGLQLAS